MKCDAGLMNARAMAAIRTALTIFLTAAMPALAGDVQNSNLSFNSYSNDSQEEHAGGHRDANTDAIPIPVKIDPDRAEYEPYDLTTMGGGLFGLFLVDQLEYRTQSGVDLLRWDAEGWYGGDVNRVWFKSEGDQSTRGGSRGGAEFHAYYSRLVAPYWDLQIGIRNDQFWEPNDTSSRFFGVVGFEGFAPYRFEVQPAAYISEYGDVSARLTATRDFLITQRVIVQSRFETEIAAHKVPQFEVGSGFNYVEFGLRVRYEVRREFAPYIGVNWERQVGQTADIIRRSGGDVDVLSIVFGLRFWY